MEIGRNANFNELTIQDWEMANEELGKKVDFLFYCKEPTSNTGNRETSEEFHSALQFCQKYSVKFVLSSSVEVLSHDDLEIKETTPIAPITTRGERFLHLEELLQENYLQQSFSYVILRFPVVYGPWQPEENGFQKLMRLQAEGKEMKPVEESYTGDVIYVSDAVNALYKAAITSVDGEVIHVTSGQTEEWQKAMELLLNKKQNKREKEIILSNEKAKKVLEFVPSVSIEDGIRLQKQHLTRRINSDL